MKAIFIGNFYPKERESEIRENSKRGIDNAANALQWALLRGLDSRFFEIYGLTAPAIRTFPFGYKKLIFKKSSFSHKNGSLDSSIEMVNIPLIKHFVKVISLRRRLKKYKDVKELVIFIYSIHSPFLKAVIDFKKNKNIIVCQIVPDLPQYMSNSSNWFYIFAKKIDKIFIDKLLKSVDCYVFLTKHMREKVPFLNKPWTVLEGIFDPTSDTTIVAKQEREVSGHKVVFYSGSLEYRYGILNLINAFSMLDDSNLQLIICGDGEAKQEIINRSNMDKRIIYKGQQPRDIVLGIMKNSDLLVNPRTPEGEFTKFSFPSKTMEYLASGVPTLLYKLPGIPEEYYDYCFVIEQLGISALSSKIREVLSLSKEKLEIIGLSARKFILNEKNPIVQCEKILRVVKSCSNNANQI